MKSRVRAKGEWGGFDQGDEESLGPGESGGKNVVRGVGVWGLAPGCGGKRGVRTGGLGVRTRGWGVGRCGLGAKDLRVGAHWAPNQGAQRAPLSPRKKGAVGPRNF